MIDDGLCTISTGIIGRSDNIAIASPMNVSDAAYAVIKRCIIGRNGIGGFARNIGKRYNCAKACSVAFLDEASETFRVV